MHCGMGRPRQLKTEGEIHYDAHLLPHMCTTRLFDIELSPQGALSYVSLSLFFTNSILYTASGHRHITSATRPRTCVLTNCAQGITVVRQLVYVLQSHLSKAAVPTPAWLVLVDELRVF